MYAVVNHLHLKSPVDQLAAKIQSEGANVLASPLGSRAFHFIKNDETHATVIILWDSEETALAGARSFGSTWFAQHIGPILASDQQRTVGPVAVTRQAL